MESHRPWRLIAAEVSQEPDHQRLSELMQQLCDSTNLNKRSRYPLTSPLTSVSAGRSLPSVWQTSYLVICGRASACSMDPASRCTSRWRSSEDDCYVDLQGPKKNRTIRRLVPCL
jgi:hypothetical protein